VDEKSVVFFDGVCGLCNRFVDFLIRRNIRGRLFFSPLQGITALELNLPESMKGMDTVVFVHRGKTYVQSAAALRILMELGGLWRAAWISLIIPRFIRDAVYNYVARNRYRWFGRKESCRLPSPEERKWFLP